MNERVLAVLRKARYLIAEPEFWTRRNYRRSLAPDQRDGRPEQEYAYCILGALQSAENRLGARSEGVAATHAIRMAVLRRTDGQWGIAGFNDYPHTTHDQVLAVFDEAIAKVEAMAVSHV